MTATRQSRVTVLLLLLNFKRSEIKIRFFYRSIPKTVTFVLCHFLPCTLHSWTGTQCMSMMIIFWSLIRQNLRYCSCTCILPDNFVKVTEHIMSIPDRLHLTRSFGQFVPPWFLLYLIVRWLFDLIVPDGFPSWLKFLVTHCAMLFKNITQDFPAHEEILEYDCDISLGQYICVSWDQ